MPEWIQPECLCSASCPAWHRTFLGMLPSLHSYAGYAFRRFRREKREDAIAEVIANCACATARLAERGKLDAAFPTILVRYAISQYFDGRRVGQSKNCRELVSDSVRRRTGIEIESLVHFDERDQEWCESLLIDKRARPAETAALRIDFAAWLKLLPHRARRIALSLARGDSATEIAHELGLSDGRVSQIRRWLKSHWDTFHDEGPETAAAAA